MADRITQAEKDGFCNVKRLQDRHPEWKCVKSSWETIPYKVETGVEMGLNSKSTPLSTKVIYDKNLIAPDR